MQRGNGGGDGNVTSLRLRELCGCTLLWQPVCTSARSCGKNPYTCPHASARGSRWSFARGAPARGSRCDAALRAHAEDDLADRRGDLAGVDGVVQTVGPTRVVEGALHVSCLEAFRRTWRSGRGRA
eukprot:3275052-Prymnesium_polylepis.1